MRHPKIAVALLLGLLSVTGSAVRADETAPPAVAVRQPEPKIQQLYDQMMAALETNDFANFAKPLDDDMKRLLTKKVFDSVNTQLGARFEKGYEAEYLCVLKKDGQTVYLWKLAFKDKGDDVLVQMALKNDKISGFLLS